MNKLNIFLGFSEVANVYSNLIKGFQALKIEYTFMTFGKNIRQYDEEVSVGFFQVLFNYFSNRQINSTGYKKKIYQIFHVVTRLPLFCISLFRFEVFVFNYNSSFFGLRDLAILKFFNKRVIYCYFGSDGRPPYLSGNYILENYTLERVYKLTKSLYYKNKKVEKYADFIISDPSYSQFFETNIVDFLSIGIPMDLSHINNKDVPVNNNFITIIHAPSTKKQKGSEHFLKIIDELKNEGFNINYIELHNVSNKVVLENIVKCDFVLDELYSDAPLAGLATEAAYFAKPSIIGGYASFDKRSLEIPPSFYVEPSEVKKAIIKLIEDKNFRHHLGERAKAYVLNYRNPEAVAKRFLKIISNDIPSEWIFDASESHYFYGWGVSKKDLKSFLKKYIGTYGKEGLFLSHNPSLENQILRFIKE